MSKDEQPSCTTCDDAVPSLVGDTSVDAPRGPHLEAVSEEAPKARAARRPRAVKEEPEAEPQSNATVADPMFFGALNETLKMMREQERHHRLSSMAIV